MLLMHRAQCRHIVEAVFFFGSLILRYLGDLNEVNVESPH